LEISPELSGKRYSTPGPLRLPDEKFLLSVAKNLDILHLELEKHISVYSVNTSGDIDEAFRRSKIILDGLLRDTDTK